MPFLSESPAVAAKLVHRLFKASAGALKSFAYLRECGCGLVLLLKVAKLAAGGRKPCLLKDLRPMEGFFRLS